MLFEWRNSHSNDRSQFSTINLCKPQLLISIADVKANTQSHTQPPALRSLPQMWQSVQQWFSALCHSVCIHVFSWESWVLPCSPLCVDELTHSSPGPMLPQSTTPSLRTLGYNSAAEQGSRVRGDKKTGYTHTHTHTHDFIIVIVHFGQEQDV